jgi:hypothetical protein
MAKTPMPWQAIEVFSSTSKWNFEMTDAILSPQEAKWAAEAKAVGLTWLKKARPLYGLFRFNGCKHEQELRFDHVRSNEVRCSICADNARKLEAATVGLTWLRKARYCFGLFRFNSCGHEQEIRYDNLKIKNFNCRSCFENKRKVEAGRVGLLWLEQKPGSRSLYRFHECGHEQEMQHGSVMLNCFVCRTCKGSWANKTSNLYVNVIEVQGEQIVKVGISRVVTRRVGEYGLPPNAQVVTLLAIPFETGLIAKQAERKVMQAFKHAKHPAAKHFFTKSGRTECFHPEFLSAILEYCKTL